jgi:phage-related protein
MQIMFNGKSYNSLEEMPVNERQAYEQLRKIFVDANGNGIPDFLEGDVAQKVITAFTKQFNYGGQVYNNLEQLPPEARQKVQAAFTKLQQMGLINPEVAEQISQKTSNFDFAFQPSSPLIQKEPVIQESSSKATGTAILVAIIILLTGCGVAAAILLFARG